MGDVNTQTTVPPVRKTVVVKQPPDRAFDLFTARMNDWWPHAALPGAAPTAAAGTVVLEPGTHGRVYRRVADQTVEVWGEVRVWEPPHRLVLTWQAVPGAGNPTEIEIQFTPQGEGTRVDLEHRGWDQLGAQASPRRAQYESGWDDAFTAYAAASRDNAPAIASLILGITSIVVPVLGLLAAPFAIIWGVRGRRRARHGARQGGLATMGLTLGAIGLVLWSVVLLLGAGLVMQSFDGGSEDQVPIETIEPAPRESPPAP
jgi:uncharacterized protein YndB with AHSA1/START domain